MGIRVLAICLRLGTGLRGRRQGLVCHKGATRPRFIHTLASLFFRSFFFAVFFLALLKRESVRAREAFGHVFFSPATSELKARSLDRHLTAGYRKSWNKWSFVSRTCDCAVVCRATRHGDWRADCHRNRSDDNGHPSG